MNCRSLVLLGLVTVTFCGWVAANQPGRQNEKVMVIPLSDEGRYMVDKVQAEFIIRTLERAENEGYSRVVLKIDTYGGVVLSAREITEKLLRLKIPTTAYVETKAISAGVFIAWACDEIVMAPHTTLGDAQMIMQTPEGIQEAPEKLVTVYRSDWKKASDAKARSFALAQGFFDVEREVLWVRDGVAKKFMLREDYEQIQPENRPTILRVLARKDQLLTLHAEEAEELGLVKIASSFDAHMQDLGFQRSQIQNVQMSFNQTLLRFLGANSWIYIVLVLIGLNGLYMELKAPGFGIPGLTALVCFAIVFGSRYFLGTANVFEMVLFGVGLILCLVEIFVLPGFGVPGLTGLACVLGALILASLPNFGGLPSTPFQWEMFNRMTTFTLIGFLGSFALAAVLIPFFVRIPAVQRRFLNREMRAEDGFVAKTYADDQALLNKEGVAEGDLRPSGKVLLDDGQLLDVASEGLWIEDGTRVRIVRVQGNYPIVRTVETKTET